MKLIELDGKNFRLRDFPVLVGRKLMTQGEGVRGIITGNLAKKLTVLAYVDVRIGEGTWVHLATEAMVANHVLPESINELVMQALRSNCTAIDSIINSPKIGDVFWSAVDNFLEEAIDSCY